MSSQDAQNEGSAFLAQPGARRANQLANDTFTRSGSPDSSSSSHARWDRLRQHVLPPRSSDSNGHSQQPSTASSATLSTRPSTPKPSRLARLGLWNVVEQARVSQSRTFADEIQKVCWHSRVVEPVKGSKFDREGIGGSTPYLPSVANSSLFSATNPIVPTSSHWRPDNRSLYNLQLSSSASRPVLLLLNILRRFAPASGVAATTLPHETFMLSVLLTPFLISEISEGIVEDRTNAVEAFEVAVKTWKAETNDLSVERCLWCCKAAAAISDPLRLRILGILWSLLSPRDSSFQANTPGAFQSLVQGLFQLLQSVASRSGQGPEPEEVRLIKQLISQVQEGACSELDRTSVEEDYGVPYARSDDDQSVRQAMVLESLVRCLENGGERSRRWFLRNALEENWAPPPEKPSFTRLLTVLTVRKLETFSRAAVSLLRSKSADTATRRYDAETIVRVFRSRVVPEAEAISGQGVTETRARLIKIILELLNADHPGVAQRWGIALFTQWYQVREWNPSFESVLKDLVQNNNWFIILRILSPLMQELPDEFRKPVLVFVLPLLHERLVVEPPPYPSPLLTDFLDSVSRWHPDIFYKPLISCTASSKEQTVTNQLLVITAVSKFVPDFWIRDLELITTVLMSDIGGQGKGKSTSILYPVWGNARLGQSALMLEVIIWIQGLRQTTEGSKPNQPPTEVMRFVTALEARLSTLLEAKEIKTLVPFPQRLLLSMLFLQIRLLTRSLKPIAWFSRTLSWFFWYWSDERSTFDQEIEAAAAQLQSLYSMAQQRNRFPHKNRNTIISPTTESGFLANSSSPSTPAIFDKQLELIASFSHGFSAIAIQLFVTLSGLLKNEDYRRLGPVLWADCLDGNDARITPSVCFLIMQCAEKDPNLLNVIGDDLKSSNRTLNIRAIHRFSTLFNWRFQILSQFVITDRERRRPFLLARDPLPFVATDVGSHLFIAMDDLAESKDNIPLEMRRQLSDIGWTEVDEPKNQKLERLQTPMSLLPVHQFDRLGGMSDQPVLSPPSPSLSPIPSPTKSPGSDDGHDAMMQRQKSTSDSKMYGVKRRVVFVPALAALLPQLASLVFNADFTVAGAARVAIMDMMRNDPALLTRPVCDLLADDQKDMTEVTRTLRAFLHVRRMLPPAMTHHVFNCLAGFLKHAARVSDRRETFKQFALMIPTISKMGTQVSDMSTREIRRAKLENFLIPSGSLWFSSSAPAVPMFPQALGTINNPFDSVSSNLVFMSIIRLSQNMFFLAMLKKNPQDVHIVRKNMLSLVLPSRENQYDTGSLDLVPRRPGSSQPERLPLDVGLTSLSLMLSRSYLLVIAQIFRSMSRHLSDRTELAIHIDGLKRILLAHGDDIGIVTHAMIALMVASTRFRRLFASKGGFTLFMSTLFKTYAEAENHPDIRHAKAENHSGIRHAIVYAVHRFYAQHGENFVFQSISTLAHLVMLPDVDGDWIAQNIFSLFGTLKSPLSPTVPDAAGIRNANKDQEREALLIRMAEEKRQIYLHSLRQGGSHGNDLQVLAEEYEAKALRSDDFVKLFLTVIAHDPSILRAEIFLRLFRFLTPYFYDASGAARSVLREGIDALGLILHKTTGKAKSAEPPPMRLTGDGNLAQQPSDAVPKEAHVDSSKTASDLSSMRMDYLHMVAAFAQPGGQLQPSSSRRMVELVKSISKDSSEERSEAISSFFTNYLKASYLRPDHPSPKDTLPFLSELAAFIPLHVFDIDFSGVFDVLSELTSNPQFARDPQFAQLIVVQICGGTLNAYESAASNRPLSSSLAQLSFISLLSKAIFLRGADIMTVLEKFPLSVDFLTAIILPLVLTLQSSTDSASNDIQLVLQHRNILTRTWVRLLSYLMSFRKGTSSDQRTKSHDKRHSSQNTRFQLLAIVIQIMKIIVICAESDLSSGLPAIWNRVASFFDTLLSDGNAAFAISPQENFYASPIQSPKLTATTYISPSLSNPTTPFGSFGNRDLNSPNQGYRKPRLVDYSMWSLFELLCQYRHPLLLQMRMLMRIKVIALDQGLRTHHNGVSNRTSRRVSSLFSKPRLSMSPTTSFSLENPLRLSALQPSPGFRQFSSPPSASSDAAHGQQIRHLGLVESPTLPPNRGSADSGESFMRPTMRSAVVKSDRLIRATYRRIRLVQSFFGYDTLLLPLPDGEQNEVEGLATSWTRLQALEAIFEETKVLADEFRESVAVENRDGTFIDANQSIAI